MLARLVAEGALAAPEAYAEAKRDGFDQDKVQGLIYLAQTTPAPSEALRMWRRFDGFDDLWTHALRKAGLDDR